MRRFLFLAATAAVLLGIVPCRAEAQFLYSRSRIPWTESRTATPLPLLVPAASPLGWGADGRLGVYSAAPWATSGRRGSAPFVVWQLVPPQGPPSPKAAQPETVPPPAPLGAAGPRQRDIDDAIKFWEDRQRQGTAADGQHFRVSFKVGSVVVELKVSRDGTPAVPKPTPVKPGLEGLAKELGEAFAADVAAGKGSREQLMKLVGVLDEVAVDVKDEARIKMRGDVDAAVAKKCSDSSILLPRVREVVFTKLKTASPLDVDIELKTPAMREVIGKKLTELADAAKEVAKQ